MPDPSAPSSADPGPGPGPGPGSVRILEGDNLPLLEQLPSEHFRLIYIDPPFNTGRRQVRTRITTVRDDVHGDRVGFKGHRYRTQVHGSKAFGDAFEDFLGFLAPRLVQAYRLLTPDGSLFVHLDYREVHYVKVLLDDIFGRDSFLNEIIWAYDYGARTKKRWSAKHDNLLWYAKDPRRYVFNFDQMDRIPYMAPGLVGPKKAARGKTPTDVWWHTIVSPNGKEKTGYPTQKPLGVLRRIINVHSNPGDAVLDFFAGSGTVGEAAAELGRDVTLIDRNEEAITVMRRRLARFLESEPEAGSDGAAESEDGETPGTKVEAESEVSERPGTKAEVKAEAEHETTTTVNSEAGPAAVSEPRPDAGVVEPTALAPAPNEDESSID